ERLKKKKKLKKLASEDDNVEFFRLKSKKKIGVNPIDMKKLENAIPLGAGFFFLILLGLTPIMSFFGGSVPSEASAINSMMTFFKKSAMAQLILTMLIAAFSLTALILSFVVRERTSDLLSVISSSLAAGWGVLMTIWTVAFMWLSWRLGSAATGDAGRVRPGAGLWLALFCSLLVIGAFSSWVATRRSKTWSLFISEKQIMLGCQVLGGLIGIII